MDHALLRTGVGIKVTIFNENPGRVDVMES